MPDPVIFSPQDDLIRDQPRAMVYTKARWTDAWVYQPHLIAVSCVHTLSAIGTATFRYEYGMIIRRGDTEVQDIPPLEIRDHWIKIVCVPNDATIEAEWIKWYGVVTSDTHERFGGSAAKAAGNQIITAMSPEYLLTRVQVTHSRIRSDTEAFFIERALSFNSAKSDRSGTRFTRGNKRPQHLAFADDLSTAEVWHSRDITEYLFQYVLKQSHGNMYPQPLRDLNISLDVDNDIIYVPLEIQADGRTLFDILQQLWSKSRGLAWRLEFLGTQAMELGFAFKVFSLSDQDVQLADQQSLPENHFRIIINTSNSNSVLRNVTQIDQSKRYKQVIAEGGFFGSVFTLSHDDQTLVPAWTEEDEQAYKDGAKDTTGYAALDLSDQRTLNDQLRTSDARYRSVFTSFNVPENWDGRPVTGARRLFFPEYLQDVDSPGPPSVSFNPGATANVSDNKQNLWLAGMRFLPYLPMLEGVDYTATDIDLPDGELPNYIRPFAVVQIDAAQRVNKSGGGYFMADAIEVAASLDEGLHKDATQTFSCSVQMHDHQLGVSVVPSGVPHKMAGNYDELWQTQPNDRAESHVKQASGDWRKLWVTVYAQSDKRVRYVWPPEPYIIQNDDGEDVPVDRMCDMHSTLLIRLGDRARMDYLAPDTVIGTRDDTRITKTTAGKLIRDDRKYLATVAKMAYAWHSTERRSLSLSLKHIWGSIKVGYLVEQLQHGRPTVMAFNAMPFIWSNGTLWLVDDQANTIVNSVITSITHNFERGTTDIVTAFAELDFA